VPNFFDKLVSKPPQYKEPARAAAAVALPACTQQGLRLVATSNGALPALDGITVVVGDRVVIPFEVDLKKSGIYDVVSLRSADADNNDELVSGTLIAILEGDTYAGGWAMLQTRDPVIGVTAMQFVIGGAVGGGGSGFHPTDIASLRLMLLSDLGTTVPTSNHVSVWADTTSGVGLSFTQSSDPGRPLLTASQLDGFPALDFVLATAMDGPLMSTLISASAYTIFVVGKLTTLSGDSTATPYSSNSCFYRDTSGYLSMGARTSGPKMQLYNYDITADIAESAGNVATGSFQLFQGRHEGGNLYARYANQADGTPVASGDTGSLAATAQLGNLAFIGSQVAHFWFNTALSAGEITNMRLWIATRYPSLSI
jgi:hypothetical protein